MDDPILTQLITLVDQLYAESLVLEKIKGRMTAFIIAGIKLNSKVEQESARITDVIGRASKLIAAFQACGLGEVKEKNEP